MDLLVPLRAAIERLSGEKDVITAPRTCMLPCLHGCLRNGGAPQPSRPSVMEDQVPGGHESAMLSITHKPHCSYGGSLHRLHSTEPSIGHLHSETNDDTKHAEEWDWP